MSYNKIKNNYENLKILKRMKSKTILSLYIFYIVFVEWVFISKVEFDIILISAVLTFLFTFALGSMLKDEKKDKAFFIELKKVYKEYEQKYKKDNVSHIDNKIENEETLMTNSFISFIVFIGASIGVSLSFSYGQDMVRFFNEPIMIAVSIVILIVIAFSLFADIIDDLEDSYNTSDGIGGFFKGVLLNWIIIPFFSLLGLIHNILLQIIFVLLTLGFVTFILGLIFGSVSKVLSLTFVIFLNVLTVFLFAVITGAIVYAIFYLIGFGSEKFSKKDIYYLDKGLSRDIDMLKYKFNITDSSFAVSDAIKYILLFTFPFIAAYLWSYFTTDIGFSVLSYLKPMEFDEINIFEFVPDWSMVKNADGFFATIIMFAVTVIAFFLSLITIPFMAIAWCIQAIGIFIVAIFNSLIGVVLLVSFLFPVLYASYLKFKDNKSLTNFTIIYIYLSFIMVIFFLSLL